jgi:hypothetical protein
LDTLEKGDGVRVTRQHRALRGRFIIDSNGVLQYRVVHNLDDGGANRQAKEFSDGQRLQMRRGLSLPILEQFRQWLEAQRPEALPKCPSGEAIAYGLCNRAALNLYRGRLPGH